MKKYVADGMVKAFELWNPADLGYLAAYAAVELASKKITGAAGPVLHRGQARQASRSARTTRVLLGPPFVFTKSNINKFNF